MAAAQPGPATTGGWPPRTWDPAAPTATSCCCSAPPAVQAVMPAAAGRRTVELLLCGHHFRASRAALTARDAAFFDVLGAPLGDGAAGPVVPAPEPLYP